MSPLAAWATSGAQSRQKWTSDNIPKNCSRGQENVKSFFTPFTLMARMTLKYHFASSVLLPKKWRKPFLASQLKVSP